MLTGLRVTHTCFLFRPTSEGQPEPERSPPSPVSDPMLLKGMWLTNTPVFEANQTTGAKTAISARREVIPDNQAA